MSVVDNSLVEQPTAGTAERHLWGRLIAVAAFALGAVLLVSYEAKQDVAIHGDAWEYWYQAESLWRHASPELQPADYQAVNDEARRLGLNPAPTVPYAYATAPDGRMYGVHFWTYALSAAAVRPYLLWSGASEFSALRLVNTVWLLLAIGVTLFASSAPIGERLALVGLAAIGPAVTYLSWTGAEEFSWALGLMAVVAYRDRREGWAGVAAGLAATQNPTAAFIGAAAVVAAAWDRRWRAAAAAALGTAVSLIPMAFFQYHFGKPNLIAAEFASADNLSWVRTWGFFADLNQGLFPYVPLLAVGTVVGAGRLVVKQDARGLILVGGTAAMALATQVQHNWNSDCFGLQRYLLWMIPAAAAITVGGLAGTRWLGPFAGAAVLVHATIFCLFNLYEVTASGYLRHTPVAGWVLEYYPRAYWIDPEVFVERELERDDWPHTPTDFPVAHVRPDGTVSKLLLDARSVDRLTERFEVDPDYVVSLRVTAAREPGLFYSHPPPAAVRVKPADRVR
ncbi:hypothetical protein [Fimbriiglobus ruber]|uniref:Glycosyltransferase RgtA/B/C/D-like domain-containing protein n=1 Tax=Fimbriiglobus ruber TaxID=1908690 RepID=A0A225EDD9_9BACT|nr:hypothetical protein [Fimbriiglobus ruber]OWK46347.1 hypothetical protein FRUB_00046 [Fimbriiglobus ruber]